ncbi:carboxylesterase 5A [Periplaneta americana]|uniref:carboxylesterase 5A n=1 Tax=Periplaneta americana TaxID=6978 RepID=UPI0037E84D7D
MMDIPEMIAVFICLTCLSNVMQVNAQEPMVVLAQGPVKGIQVFSDSRQIINAFLGIPYAAAPIGELRFAPPERHPGWNRTMFSAGRFAPACPQLQESSSMAQVRQEEDCLYLNIWTPETPPNFRRGLPIVILLEGEGFVSGLVSRFPGQDLAAEGVIVVSVSYRLNVFGFFCLEDSEARGNLGLLDQYFALLWVRENIEQFGGDPRSITLMGHSAGAASVMYHITSPRTAGLFHRAIVMSGSVTSPWSRAQHPGNSSRGIARSLGCFATTSRAILSCLRTKSTAEILRAFETQYKNGNWTAMVLPVVDTFLPETEQYLPRDPKEVLQTGNYITMPLLTGTTSHEGAVTLYQWSDLVRQSYLQLRHFFEHSAIPGVMEHYGFGKTEQIREILKWRYPEKAGENSASALLLKLLEFYSDSQFVAPHVRQLELLSHSTEPLFVYKFQQSGPDLYGNTLNISGSAHGSEFLYLFGPTLMMKLSNRRFTPDEERFSKRMKRHWADFIKQGNPNGAGFGLAWQRAKPDNYNCWVLMSELQQQGQPPRCDVGQNAADMWNDLLPRLQQLVDTKSPPEISTTDSRLGSDSSQPFRSAMYTLIGFVAVLLVMLVVCLVLLKRHAKERDRDLF